MMRNHAIALVLLGSLFCPCFRLAATPIQLPVQIENQEQGNWCWAASSLALMNRYDIYPGVTVETGSGYRGQCLIAQKLPEHSEKDCCDSPEDCNHTATVEELANIIEDDYGIDIVVSGTITEQVLIDLITAGKPVVIYRESPQYNHFLAVIGYNDNDNFFEVLEVLGGYIVTKTYNQISSETPWTWQNTIRPTNAPPDDVFLRYTRNDPYYEWTYSAPGNLFSGPDYFVTYTGNEKATFTCGADSAITLKPFFRVEAGANFQAIPQS